jgi:hypothetical protein
VEVVDAQDRGGGVERRGAGKEGAMRFGNVEVRPLGGGLGCLGMIAFSILASLILTLALNLILR